MTNELATIEPLTQALALATEAGDLRALNDVQALASALQKGAQARGMGVVAENKAAEIVVRAERAMGLSLQRMLETGERRASGVRDYDGDGVRPLPPTLDQVLSAAGVKATPPTLQAWRRLAAVPDDRFEELLREHREKDERIARVNFYRDDAEAARKRAAKDLREVLSEDEAPLSVVETFRAAAEAMIAAMSQTPGEELATVAGLIKALYDEYVQVMRGA